MILVVAATHRELEGVRDADTLACGVGPVEAAASTARALATKEPAALLHVGIAGARGLAAGTVVIGSEAVYEDARGPLVPERVEPDPALFAATRSALPEAQALPIGTSARVGGTAACTVEGMEGFAVLRAAALAGVPAVEVRVVSNEIDEPDRSRWNFEEAFATLAETIPRLLSYL